MMKKGNQTDFVLDCSVTMAWCFEDEMTEYSETVFNSLICSNAIVPSLWSLEVANVLLCAQRKKRISKIKVIEFKESLKSLPIQIDHSTAYRSNTIMELAEETQLTIYDATYLELAIHQATPLATLDQTLQKAAKKIGISLFFPANG